MQCFESSEKKNNILLLLLRGYSATQKKCTNSSAEVRHIYTVGVQFASLCKVSFLPSDPCCFPILSSIHQVHQIPFKSHPGLAPQHLLAQELELVELAFGSNYQVFIPPKAPNCQEFLFLAKILGHLDSGAAASNTLPMKNMFAKKMGEKEFGISIGNDLGVVGGWTNPFLKNMRPSNWIIPQSTATPLVPWRPCLGLSPGAGNHFSWQR